MIALKEITATIPPPSQNLKGMRLRLSRFGIMLSLVPISLSNSYTALGICLTLFAISLINRPRLLWSDAPVALISILTAISWFFSDPIKAEFIIAQTSSYFILALCLRFFDSCSQVFIDFAKNASIKFYAFICIIYIAIQIKIGYEYEIGSLETFIFMSILLNPRRRVALRTLLISYFLIMFMISTRSTPLLAAMIAIAAFTPAIKSAIRPICLGIVILAPATGLIFYGMDSFNAVLDLDDNAAIRYEMIKGGTSLIGFKEFIFGTGFGHPFRDIYYDYNIDHPLLYSEYLIYQVSNHNSLFDIFLRLGIFAYIAFAIFLLRADRMVLRKKGGEDYFAITALCVSSLMINAYADSTKLTLHLTVMVAALIFTAKSQSPGNHQP